jgi:hypothetical protein
MSALGGKADIRKLHATTLANVSARRASDRVLRQDESSQPWPPMRSLALA